MSADEPQHHPQGSHGLLLNPQVSELIHRSSHTTPFPFVILTSHVCRRPEMKVSADLSTTTDTPDNRSTSNEGGGVAEVEAKAKVEPALNRHAGHRKKTRTPTYTDQCFTYGRRRKKYMSIHHHKQGCCWLRTYRRAAQSVKKSLARLSTRGVSSVSVCATATVVRPPLSML